MEMARIGLEKDVIAGVLKVDVSQVEKWLAAESILSSAEQ